MIISMYYDEPQGTSTIFVLTFGTTMIFYLSMYVLILVFDLFQSAM